MLVAVGVGVYSGVAVEGGTAVMVAVEVGPGVWVKVGTTANGSSVGKGSGSAGAQPLSTPAINTDIPANIQPARFTNILVVIFIRLIMTERRSRCHLF